MTVFLGKTIAGDGRGKTLGFPTLNINLCKNEENSMLQKNSGVFIVELQFQEKFSSSCVGLLHLGSRPTFQEKEFRIEIFVLEKVSQQYCNHGIEDLHTFLHQVDLGASLQFTLQKKIREVICFSSAEDLVEQIKKDVMVAEDYFQKYRK